MDTKTVKTHDGIVGAALVLSIYLGMNVTPVWFWVPAVIGVLMVISAFTGFCPVYFILGKLGLK